MYFEVQLLLDQPWQASLTPNIFPAQITAGGKYRAPYRSLHTLLGSSGILVVCITADIDPALFSSVIPLKIYDSVEESKFQ